MACTAPVSEKPAAPAGAIVEIETTKGRFVIQLSDKTPQHRDNFLKLVSESAYDSVLFHRVIENFVIQAGDPDSRYAAAGDTLGEGDRDYKVPAEFDPTLFHKRGALGAARDGNPERASSAMQFYIVQRGPQADSTIDKGQARINGWLQDNHAINAPGNDAVKEAIERAEEAGDYDQLPVLYDSLKVLRDPR